MKRILTAAILICAPTLAFADNCDQPNLTGFDGVYCFSKVFIGEDTRLNGQYSALRAELNGDQRTILRDAQRGWIGKRDATCLTGPSTVNVNCALSMTRDRADFLSARVVECQTVGCAASKLRDY